MRLVMKKCHHTLLVAVITLASQSTFALGSKPPSTPPPASSETQRWRNMIEDFGGKVVDASRYSQNAQGFQSYLTASGIRNYDAADLIAPYNKSAAKNCGYDVLLPSKEDWVRGAALALWAEDLAHFAGELPIIRNWYRPSCYNSAVGGASKSDHLTARAIDMDFDTLSARRKAQKELCRYWNTSLNMQIGLGGQSIHLGAESPLGKRHWYYDSYQDSDRGNSCFD